MPRCSDSGSGTYCHHHGDNRKPEGIHAFYGVAGAGHLLRPELFAPIMPDWVPFPQEVILGTGVCELAGAVALLTVRLRWIAGVMLALYALCVWPANFNHAINDIAIGGNRLPWAYHGPRLLFQPVIVWWCLWASTAIDWPFRRSQAAARVPPISMDRI